MLTAKSNGSQKTIAEKEDVVGNGRTVSGTIVDLQFVTAGGFAQLRCSSYLKSALAAGTDTRVNKITGLHPAYSFYKDLIRNDGTRMTLKINTDGEVFLNPQNKLEEGASINFSEVFYNGGG